MRQPLAAEREDFLCARARALFESDEGFGTLAPALVGNPDHRAFEHGRVGADGLLDLDRRDVLAAGDDDVLGAVAQFDVAVGVPDGQITGVEPAAAKRLSVAAGSA